MSADSTVRKHLFAVVDALRGEPTPTPERAPARARMLDLLEAYARGGRFPRNEPHTRPRPRRNAPPRAFDGPGPRTPRFRDVEGTWCAVGHLIACTDPDLADSIARRYADRWVGEMDDPALLAWAERHGLRADDLEWIQPAYFCENMEHCEGVDLDAPATLPASECAGADPALASADNAVTWCGDCDGNVLVWVWLHNRGDQPTGDVTVLLHTGRVVESGDVLDQIVVSDVAPGSVREVGPFIVSSLPRSVRLAADEDCDFTDNVSEPDAWLPGLYSGMGGWGPPRRCAGRQACHEPGCGCGSTRPAPGFGGLLAASIAALAVRRRRTA